MKHWRREADGDGAWLLLDVAGRSTNTLNDAVLSELDELLQALENERPARLMIRSGKDNGFCYGADIGMLEQAGDNLASLLRRGHAVLDRLEVFPAPVVAVLQGPCLGGGLELALACDCRVATPDAQLGFPEVQLGLHPGLGGTWRLPQIIPAPEALELMLTGRSLDAQAARALDLVDEVVPPRHMLTAARACEAKRAGRFDRAKAAVAESAPARPVIAGMARKKTRRRIRREHFPAPFALLDLWEAHGGDRDLLEHEAQSFASLARSQTARNLMRVFRLREQLKGRGKDQPSPAIRRVHVIGAGVMGADIAAWAALKGCEVTLQDPDDAQLGRAMVKAHALFARRSQQTCGRRPIDRYVPDPNGHGLRGADLVIEAVPERTDLKQQIYEQALPQMRPEAVLATNTSSIALENLALGDPSRLVGLHFFNPVAQMPLIEIVRGTQTADHAFATAMTFAAQIDKLPLPVKSSPGFLVNRVLLPYLLEAALLLDDGYRAEDIDEAAEAFGMLQGPLETADMVGLDVCAEVGAQLAQHLEGAADVPGRVRRMVDVGELGQKSNKGFYDYEDGKPHKREPSESRDPELQDRLILALLNTAVACLRERVVEGADDLDAGLVFGAGFAPFRGGPLHYARQAGIDDVRTKLHALAERHERFRPDPGWETLQEN